MSAKSGVKLPGMKGYWRKPDRVEVNEAGVPVYVWLTEIDGVLLDKPIKMAAMSPAPRPPRES